MVPNGWVKTTFDSLIDILVGFSFKSDQYTENSTDILLLRGDNIEPGALRWKNAKRWPSDKIQDLQKYQLIKGDFVIAMDRTWITSGLKVAEVTEKDLPCLLVQRVARIRTNNKLEQRLLTHYFSSYQFEQYVKSVQLATAVPHISSNNIKNFPILLPPIQEQQKIAEILSTWDKAIETTEKLISNSQTQKRALMQQLLTGKKRLLDENGERFSGQWEKVKISRFLSESKQPSINNDPSKRLTVRLHLNGIEAREFRGTEAENSTTHFIRKAGQFIYGRQNFHKGAFGIIPKELDLYESSQDIPCFDFTDKCSPLWFFYMCSRKNFYEFIENLMTGTGSKRLHPSSFLEISFATPSLQEQTKIATVLSSADREIEFLENKLKYLKEEKKALMQQLLTGKRRVKVDN